MLTQLARRLVKERGIEMDVRRLFGMRRDAAFSFKGATPKSIEHAFHHEQRTAFNGGVPSSFTLAVFRNHEVQPYRTF